MKCKDCGAEIPDGAKFCPVCGKPADGEKECEAAPARSGKAELISGCILSGMAFVFGFVLLVIGLVRKTNVGHDMLAFFPAIIGIVLDSFALVRADENKNAAAKTASIVALGLACFTVFFGFIAYCVLLA